MIAEFINVYGAELLRAALVAIAGWLAAAAKKLAAKHINEKIKKDVARTVVQFVEQVYKDLHGDEKLNAALAAFSEMLAEKGITITELEMRMLIEAAVGEFNEAFKKQELKAITE